MHLANVSGDLVVHAYYQDKKNCLKNAKFANTFVNLYFYKFTNISVNFV